MNSHPKQELSLFAEELYRYMSAAILNQLAIEAGVKIQLEYDLLSGEFSDVKIEPGKRSDQAYSATRTNMIQKNELYIRDLGYFRLQDFKAIQNKQGYYLSRLKLPTKIYRKEFETVVFKSKK